MGSQLLARNRWLVVTGAIIIQLALGALYAWSVFTARLTDQAGAYAFSASETAWVFSTGFTPAESSTWLVSTTRWPRRLS